MQQVQFQTPEQAIATAVDKSGKPSARLLELLSLHAIDHNGTLKDIVVATQNAFQILHPSGRPKKRWEIVKWTPKTGPKKQASSVPL